MLLFYEKINSKITACREILECQDTQKQYVSKIGELLEYHYNGIVWKDIVISQKANNESRLFSRNVTPLAGGQIREVNIDNTELYDMGVIYDILYTIQLMGVNLGGITKELFREKAVSKAKNACSESLHKLQETYSNYFSKETDNYLNQVNKLLHEGFLVQTGIEPDDIEKVVWNIDRYMTELGLHDEKVPFYPVVIDGKLKFVQSVYLERLQSIRTGSQEYAFKNWMKPLLEQVFARKRKQLTSDIRSRISSYDGNRAIEKTGFNYLMPLAKDTDLLAVCEIYPKIVFPKHIARMLEKMYQVEGKKLEAELDTIWKREADKREDEVLRAKIKASIKEYDEQFKHFTTVWQKALTRATDQYMLMNNYTALPAEWDYYEFYRQVYFNMYPGYPVVQYIKEFMDTGEISLQLTDQIRIVGVDGRKLSHKVENEVAKWMAGANRQLTAIVKPYKDKWDQVIEPVEDNIKAAIKADMDAARDTIQNKLLPLWQEYNRTYNGSDRYRINSFKEFVEKSAKVPVDLEHRCRQRMGYAAMFVKSDGSRIGDNLDRYIKGRMEELRGIK